MKRLWLGLVFFVAFPASAAWLKLDKSADGFLFQGAEDGEPFAFNVPGTSVRTAKDGNRAFAEIDGVLVQVMLVPVPPSAAADPAGGFMVSEQRYLESAGASIVPSSVCSGLHGPHGEWASSVGGHLTRYLATTAGKRLLVVTVVASNPNVPESAAADVFASVCSSLKVA